jgi:hypothetical protein
MEVNNKSPLKTDDKNSRVIVEIKRCGQPSIKNIFKFKKTYENIFTGINKEEVLAKFTYKQMTLKNIVVKK